MEDTFTVHIKNSQKLEFCSSNARIFATKCLSFTRLQKWARLKNWAYCVRQYIVSRLIKIQMQISWVGWSTSILSWCQKMVAFVLSVIFFVFFTVTCSIPHPSIHPIPCDNSYFILILLKLFLIFFYSALAFGSRSSILANSVNTV